MLNEYSIDAAWLLCFSPLVLVKNTHYFQVYFIITFRRPRKELHCINLPLLFFDLKIPIPNQRRKILVSSLLNLLQVDKQWSLSTCTLLQRVWLAEITNSEYSLSFLTILPLLKIYTFRYYALYATKLFSLILKIIWLSRMSLIYNIKVQPELKIKLCTYIKRKC